MSVIELNNENFYEQLMLCEKPALVDFYADWCAPCKRMMLIIEELSEQLSDVVFFRINIDSSRETAREYEITSIPTMLLIIDGQEEGRIVGGCSAEELTGFIYNESGSEELGDTPEPEQGDS